jgi:hypothetical protein
MIRSGSVEKTCSFGLGGRVGGIGEMGRECAGLLAQGAAIGATQDESA